MIKKLSTDDLKAKLDDEGVFYALVDTGSPEEFEKEHLPNAINIPLDKNFDKNVRRKLRRRDQMIIAYGRFENGPKARIAAESLERLGYTDVYYYKGSKEKWKKQSLPLEGARKTFIIHTRL